MSAQVEGRVETLSAKIQTLALEISNLSAFGATLAQTPDPHAELQRLADMIRAMFDADSAGVFLVYEGHTTRACDPFETRDTEHLTNRLSGFAGVLDLNWAGAYPSSRL